jgi:hypothetical protein
VRIALHDCVDFADACDENRIAAISGDPVLTELRSDCRRNSLQAPSISLSEKGRLPKCFRCETELISLGGSIRHISITTTVELYRLAMMGMPVW